MPGFFRGESFLKAKAAGGPWADVLALATSDGWLACYDPTNPGTRTLRNSGGTDYFTAIADGLGNWPDLVQATEAKQPILSAGYFGDLDAMQLDGSSQCMKTASAVTSDAQPHIILIVRRLSTLAHVRFNISVTGHTAGREHHMQVESYAWGGYLGMFAGAGMVGGTRQTTPEVVSALFNGASSQYWRDGSSLNTGNAGTRELDGLTVGANLNETSEFWPGEIGPVLVRDDTDTTAMQDMVTLLLGLM